MKIAIITSAYTGFFPSFYKNLSAAIRKRGDESILLLPNSGINRGNNDAILWGYRLNWFIHYYLYRLFGLQDIFSILSTYDLIRKLKRAHPDIIHLHVINAWVINMPIFIHFISNSKIKVVWTMHDCRAFTGRCAYFDEVSCDKWKTGCGACPQKTNYWPTIIDSSHAVWYFRKSYSSKFKELTIVTPSIWLKDLVKQSFFKKFHITCIYNGIDVQRLSPKIRLKTAFFERLRGLKIILGVAAIWEDRKGFNSFLYLAKYIPQDWRIILVGKLNGLQIKALPQNIVYYGSTNNQSELISLYQRADVFVNPTLADNFPTTNIESLACGTPVVTFNTGGCGEAIDDRSGIVVEKGDNHALLNAVKCVISNTDIFSAENCMKRSLRFSLSQYDKYTQLYHTINN